MLPKYTPMHPTQIREPFHRPGWVYEEKVDGWRPSWPSPCSEQSEQPYRKVDGGHDDGLQDGGKTSADTGPHFFHCLISVHGQPVVGMLDRDTVMGQVREETVPLLGCRGGGR